jgi:hypothetical protein
VAYYGQSPYGLEYPPAVAAVELAPRLAATGAVAPHLPFGADAGTDSEVDEVEISDDEGLPDARPGETGPPAAKRARAF